MDFSLLISAQPLQLAPHLQTTPVVRGLMVVKNVEQKTYLRVTPEQWALLRLFEERRAVPAVLDRAIRERRCVRLGEFYELVLKAERAGILIGQERTPPAVEVCDWRGRLSPRLLAHPAAILLFAGLVLSLGFPEVPSSLSGLAMGALILVVAYNLSEYIRGCLLHGAGGEVYQRRSRWWRQPLAFRIDASDAVMLPRKVQDALLITDVAVLAAAAGLTRWHAPAWSFIPLLGLMLKLQPGPGGGFPSVLRLAREHELSDAEHSFLFPPNRTTRSRWQALVRYIRQLNTWVLFAYAALWSLAVVYLAARLTGAPVWTYAFWEAHGGRIAVPTVGVLLLLGLTYAVGEFLLYTQIRGRTWIHSVRKWRARWWGGHRRPLDEAGRLAIIAGAPALRPLNAIERQELARALEPLRHPPWRALRSFEGLEAAQVGLIVNGRVTVRRIDAGGRKRQIQVLGPGDLIGLHDAIDPRGATHRLRALTPITLLALPRAAATELILNRVARSTLVNMVLKVPFLRDIPLCRNWHQQAIERFAQVSTLDSFPDGKTIYSDGQIIDRFFVMYEGEARVLRGNGGVGVIRTGEFFGEIGLLQNSNASSTVTTRRSTRTLTIARTEFLRFVTHNYAVALELERVSSKRLGHPIFPVRQSHLGDRLHP